ncbi:MAG: F0F1 ATP synthase subunit B [Planctomycetota bacterium]
MPEFFASNFVNFWWGLSAFIVFVLVIYRLGMKNILDAVDGRDAKIRKDIADAEDASTKAIQLNADLAKKIRELEDKVSTVLNQARLDAETAREALLEKGRSEVEGIRLRSQQDIEAARHAAIVSLRREIAEIATDVATKIVTEKLDATRQEELVGQAITAYEQSAKRS